MNIDDITKEGFLIKKERTNIDSISFLTLRISLEAYFKTYKCASSYLSSLNSTDTEIENKDYLYSFDYIENACESISHFQHFVELFLKDILRNTHILLSIDASKKNVLFYNLLFGEANDDFKIEDVKQLEFSEALKRIVELIKADKIDKNKFNFIVEYKKVLEELNTLRNRIAHRGAFVLRYKSLDFLFGKFLFPFLLKVMEIDSYSRISNWSYNNNYININPIKEICKHFNSEQYSVMKIALLKEIGRASIENPIRLTNSLLNYYNEEEKKRAETFAKAIHRLEHLDDVVKCPICGTESLVKYQDHYDEDSDEDSDQIGESFYYIFGVKCFCCSFEIDNKIPESELTSFNIENYWIAK